MALAFLLGACAAEPLPEPKELVWPPPPDQPRYYYEGMIRSSADVVEDGWVTSFRRFATGEGKTGKGLAKPFGVAADRGRVFVSDTVGRKVAVFDFAGKRYYEIGARGVGALVKPLGVALDRANQLLYVVDSTAQRVVAFDYEGEYRTAMGGDELLRRPSGVAVSPDGRKIYVVDTGGVDSRQHKVVVFDPDGRHLFDIGERGTADGDFNLPLSATTAADGTLHVVDGGNFRVQSFSPSGGFIDSFGGVGRRPGQFSRPKSIAAGPDGTIVVSDAAFGNIQLFDSEGRLLMFIGQRSEEGGAAQYMLTSGVGMDEDGRIYVVDQFFGKVDIFRPAKIAPNTLAEAGAAP
ncbi:MAG: 6-bladed beta-propeller [Alphaproteobacteria bacterium]|nr:6-bladed beta-propeller [Alphaproteobacteria bacterium]